MKARLLIIIGISLVFMISVGSLMWTEYVMVCNNAVVSHMQKSSNLFDENTTRETFAVEDIGYPFGVHSWNVKQCVDHVLEQRIPDFKQTKIQNKETAQNMPIPDGKPYESTVFGGVPMISTYQLSDMHPIEKRAYHLVNEKTDQFVLDAIANGVTLITRDGRIAYNEKYIQSDAKNRFEVKNDDGSSTYYRLNYDEPKIHVTSHYVKLFVYDNNDPYAIKDARDVSSSDAEKFDAILDDAYVWVKVDEQTAYDVKNIISENGHTLKIGNTVADVYYFGPFSDDLQRTEIRNMYADKLGLDKIE